MALEFTTSYVKDSILIFRYYKKLGEGAIAEGMKGAVFIPCVNPFPGGGTGQQPLRAVEGA